jgi:hypothetical protein
MPASGPRFAIDGQPAAHDAAGPGATDTKRFDHLIRRPQNNNNEVRMRRKTQLKTMIAHSTVYPPMRASVTDFLISPFGRNSFCGVSNQR